MATVKENLIAAKALIDTPEKWMKGGYRHALPTGGACFCSVGALMQVRCLPPSEVFDTEEYLALEEAAGDRTVVGYNDHYDTQHTDIMDLFDRAITAQDDQP